MACRPLKSSRRAAFLLWCALSCAALGGSAHAAEDPAPGGSKGEREGWQFGPEEAQDEPPDQAAGAPAEAAADPAEEPEEAAAPAASAPLTVTSRGAASSRGEASLELLAQAPAGPLLLRFGPGVTSAAQGPPRVAALLGASTAEGGLDLLLRLLPAQSGASLAAARFEARSAAGSWEAGLVLEAARLSLAAGALPARTPALSLTTAAATGEGVRALAGGVSLALHLSGGLCALSTTGAGRPSLWLLPGARAGQWPQRGAAGVAARLERPGWSARLDATASLPAAAGGSALELALSLERQWTRFGLVVEVAGTRLQPEGTWLGRLALELRWEGA
jgi:hypothetical protein